MLRVSDRYRRGLASCKREASIAINFSDSAVQSCQLSLLFGSFNVKLDLGWGTGTAKLVVAAVYSLHACIVE